MKIIAETDRVLLRELDSDLDAEFIFRLLNSNKFLRHIGDRGVRNVEQAADFIETRYRQSYRVHGFGLYTVETKAGTLQIGICGFVRREGLSHPDIGFAFLPEFEKQGYGFESAMAIMEYGRADLGMTQILAITTTDNSASGKLLERLGFRFVQLIKRDDETLKLYSSES